MGMFDDLHCEHALPAPNTDRLSFQTKDLCCDMDTLLLKADGTLWRTASSWGDNYIGFLDDYFGEVRFYTCGTGDERWWLEFRARFADGRLHSPIALIEDTRPDGAPTLAMNGLSDPTGQDEQGGSTPSGPTPDEQGTAS